MTGADGRPVSPSPTPVTVAVIDSGVHVPHPHLPDVAGGISIDLEGRASDDVVDRIGHGTAVAAAIHEKAPNTELWAVKVFDRELATSVAVREILFTGRLFDAGEALGMGMVNRVADDAELDDVVQEYCDRIAGNAPLSVRAAKLIVREATRDRADQDAELCERLVNDCFNSDDYVEGRRAFAQKRAPQFKGR